MSVRNAVTGSSDSDQSILFGNNRSGRVGLGLVVIFIFLQLFRLLFKILHNYGNASIGCVEGRTGSAQHLIGVASDLRNLIASQTIVLHQPAGGVGAVRGKLPISVLAPAGIGLGIGVAFNGEMVR